MMVTAQNRYYMIFKETINTSLLFLLPLVARENENYLDYTQASNLFSKRDDSFINGYNKDINKPWLDRHVFLLFNAAIDPMLSQYWLKSNENYTSNYAIRKDGIFYQIYSYRIPDKYEDDYKKIIEGQYKDISDETKAVIINFWETNTNSLLFNSMYGKSSVLGKIESEDIEEVDFIKSKEEILEKIMEDM